MCPACGREFARQRSHVCAPALSVNQYFAARPPWEREVYELVRAHIESLGPVIVEPVNVGIFFKGKRNFVELRPKTRWLDLTFGLNRLFDHPRFSRTMKTRTARTYYAVRVTGPRDIDEQVLGWITESYFDVAF
jgi:predicted transport protein